MTRTARPPDGEIRPQVRRGDLVRLRVLGFSLLPAVPPGAWVELRAVDLPHLAKGDLVVVEIQGNLVCHALESVGDGASGPVVTRGLWASLPDPPVPTDALVGAVAFVQVLGFRMPATGPAFRSWLALGRGTAPLVRGVRAVAWPWVPAALKERLRHGLGRRLP
jgi:hypothetical protein